MSSNTSLSRKDYFLALSRKIFLTPSSSQLEECCDFLDSISEDISSLENLDLSDCSIYYGKSEFSIPFGSFTPFEGDEENGDLLNSLIENYEFTNIRSEDKKE